MRLLTRAVFQTFTVARTLVSDSKQNLRHRLQPFWVAREQVAALAAKPPSEEWAAALESEHLCGLVAALSQGAPQNEVQAAAERAVLALRSSSPAPADSPKSV